MKNDCHTKNLLKFFIFFKKFQYFSIFEFPKYIHKLKLEDIFKAVIDITVFIRQTDNVQHLIW